MHHHYAGNWYPYQDEKGHNPGVIVDPKSPVVVGAAIEFMARHGMLPQFKFEMKGKAKEIRRQFNISVSCRIAHDNTLFFFNFFSFLKADV